MRKRKKFSLEELSFALPVLNEMEQKGMIGCGSGTQSDPYSMEEFLSWNKGPFPGGFVLDMGGSIVYTLPEVMCYSYSYGYGEDSSYPGINTPYGYDSWYTSWYGFMNYTYGNPYANSSHNSNYDETMSPFYIKGKEILDNLVEFNNSKGMKTITVSSTGIGYQGYLFDDVLTALGANVKSIQAVGRVCGRFSTGVGWVNTFAIIHEGNLTPSKIISIASTACGTLGIACTAFGISAPIGFVLNGASVVLSFVSLGVEMNGENGASCYSENGEAVTV